MESRCSALDLTQLYNVALSMCFSYVRSCVRHFTHSEFPISAFRYVAIDYLLGSINQDLVCFRFSIRLDLPHDDLFHVRGLITKLVSLP